LTILPNTLYKGTRNTERDEENSRTESMEIGSVHDTHLFPSRCSDLPQTLQPSHIIDMFASSASSWS